jgi:hypothetical protein
LTFAVGGAAGQVLIGKLVPVATERERHFGPQLHIIQVISLPFIFRKTFVIRRNCRSLARGT